MSQALAVDQEYVEEQTIKAWNSWTKSQRRIWLLAHSLPYQPNRKYEALCNEIQDALFCEYLDNAKKDFE